jgi:hypothetical protein
MHNIAVSAPPSNVDMVARVIGIAGVLIAIASLAFTWYQWHHSGPGLASRVEVNVGKDRAGERDEQWIFTIDVSNNGRMPVTVRDATLVRLRWRWHFAWWFNWWLRLIRRSTVFGTSAHPVDGEFPKEIPPTGYLSIRAVVDADLFEPLCTRWVQAVVWSGDMRTSRSAVIRDPSHRRLSRSLRKMLAQTNRD